MRLAQVLFSLGLCTLGALPERSSRAGEVGEATESGETQLSIVSGGKSDAKIIVSPSPAPWEKRAAADLAHSIERMTGARIPILGERHAIDAALLDDDPLLIVGVEALKAQGKFRDALGSAVKKNPHLRTDGIVLKREGSRLYLAGNNDPSHYYAVAELLRRWGCRWYMPTDFGECIPETPDLKVGNLDHVHASPFEIRSYWISWNGDSTGAEEFSMRNLMTGRGDMPPTGHALGQFTRGLGKGTFDFPITEPRTARYVAGQVEEAYAKGGAFSLGMEDGAYDSDYPGDRELMKLQWDKYFMRWSVTDPMLELYNGVARILQAEYPDAKGKIGFLAYANMTIPPVRKMVAERSLYCELAPIDIDPIHGMDDPRSPPRGEYREMLYRWAEVMRGRLCIYDYDQGMLVWRDIPNPSHQSFRQDVLHYRRAGILGVNTESRNAIATTFLNLYVRARLLWNPDEDVDGLLEEFYPKFYGPAAEPMRRYWSAIYRAWQDTIVTEHEYFIIPAIYTPQVMAVLESELAEAERAVNGIRVQGRALTPNEALSLRRMEFTRTSYEILDAYTKMVAAAATHVDYRTAVAAGERGLEARAAMTALGGMFTTTKLEGDGAPWWPGEVRQYRELLDVTDGPRGKLVLKLSLEWEFRRDPERKGLERGYHSGAFDLSYWDAHGDEYDAESRKDYPANEWEMLRTDLYAQAQGIRHPDRQSFTGDMWYRSDLQLGAEEIWGAVHLRFPGLFNECWLYVNGEQVGHREQGKLFWLNDYRFEWDVDLSGRLKAGKNTLALRCKCEHHFGGMFRRPFLYRKIAP
jgi:hypothetical protein